MILTALPLPPLPVIVQRLDEDGRVCEELLQTSHDIISNLLIHACARNDPKENAERKRRQQEVLRSLIDHMCCRGQLQTIPELYETYCDHTRYQISTYIPAGGASPPMKFAPLSSVNKGDPTHRRMCDYMAGQAIILDEPNGKSAQDWLCREYADMLSINRARLLQERQNPPGPLPGHFIEEEADEDDIPKLKRENTVALESMAGVVQSTPE